MTALSHSFGLFNIDECKVYALTADPAGGSPTYGAAISVPGIRDLNITPDVLSKELYGDAQILANKTRVRAYKATASHAKLNLDALALFLGGAVTDTSTTPTRVAAFADADATVVPGYFKLEARIAGVEGELASEAVKITLYKCSIDAASLGGAQEDWAIPTLSMTAVRLNSNGKRIEIGLYETPPTLDA